MEKPNCECHGEAMYWQPEPSMKAGGRWRCVVWKREYDREYKRKRRATDPKWAARDREAQRRQYAADPERHREISRKSYHGGGWITRRKRDLTKQRTRITEQLVQLEQEATAC